jgi:hypothetical protein
MATCSRVGLQAGLPDPEWVRTRKWAGKMHANAIQRKQSGRSPCRCGAFLLSSPFPLSPGNWQRRDHCQWRPRTAGECVPVSVVGVAGLPLDGRGGGAGRSWERPRRPWVALSPFGDGDGGIASCVGVRRRLCTEYRYSDSWGCKWAP